MNVHRAKQNVDNVNSRENHDGLETGVEAGFGLEGQECNANVEDVGGKGG